MYAQLHSASSCVKYSIDVFKIFSACRKRCSEMHQGGDIGLNATGQCLTVCIISTRRKRAQFDSIEVFRTLTCPFVLSHKVRSRARFSCLYENGHMHRRKSESGNLRNDSQLDSRVHSSSLLTEFDLSVPTIAGIQKSK